MGVEGDVTGFNWHLYRRLCSHPFWHLLSRYTWADDIILPSLAFLLWKTNTQEALHRERPAWFLGWWWGQNGLLEGRGCLVDHSLAWRGLVLGQKSGLEGPGRERLTWGKKPKERYGRTAWNVSGICPTVAESQAEGGGGDKEGEVSPGEERSLRLLHQHACLCPSPDLCVSGRQLCQGVGGDGVSLTCSNVCAPPFLRSSADPLIRPTAGTALLTMSGGLWADYFGEFGLTLLIDQN